MTNVAEKHEAADTARLRELVDRLVGPGPKASHVSASECHEIRNEVIALIDRTKAQDAFHEAGDICAKIRFAQESSYKLTYAGMRNQAQSCRDDIHQLRLRLNEISNLVPNNFAPVDDSDWNMRVSYLLDALRKGRWLDVAKELNAMQAVALESALEAVGDR